jgi:hypothetical protein
MIGKRDRIHFKSAIANSLKKLSRKSPMIPDHFPPLGVDEQKSGLHAGRSWHSPLLVGSDSIVVVEA